MSLAGRRRPRRSGGEVPRWRIAGLCLASERALPLFFGRGGPHPAQSSSSQSRADAVDTPERRRVSDVVPHADGRTSRLHICMQPMKKIVPVLHPLRGLGGLRAGPAGLSAAQWPRATVRAVNRLRQ
jgi:hypothetical protein